VMGAGEARAVEGNAPFKQEKDSEQSALTFIDLADVFEDLAGGGRRAVMCGFVLCVADEAAQVLSIGFRVLSDERFERLVVARDQAIPPALEGVKALVVLACRAVELIDDGENTLDVLIPHELAQVLDMTLTGNVRLVLRRRFQRAAHIVAERQAFLHLRFERGEPFAQCLQGVKLAFDLGFTLLFGEVVERFSHGAFRVEKRRHDNQSNLACPVRPAAMAVQRNAKRRGRQTRYRRAYERYR
jgi:hypothetical protein